MALCHWGKMNSVCSNARVRRVTLMNPLEESIVVSPIRPHSVQSHHLYHGMLHGRGGDEVPHHDFCNDSEENVIYYVLGLLHRHVRLTPTASWAKD